MTHKTPDWEADFDRKFAVARDQGHGCYWLWRLWSESEATPAGMSAAQPEHIKEFVRSTVRELVDAASEVLRLSDRKHDAWDRLHAALAQFKEAP